MTTTELRDHLAKTHGWSDFDFTLFGDTPAQQERYLPGAHDQDHEANAPHTDHTHEEVN